MEVPPILLMRRLSAASLVLASLGTVPLAAQTTTFVSENVGNGASDGASENPVVSAGGRFVAFQSLGSNLVPNDTNSRSDIFVRDLATATTIRVSVAPGGGNSNDTSRYPRISGRGRYVAFESYASNLVPGDTILGWSVFVRDAVQEVYLRDRGVAATSNFCFGDGTQATACPCGNSGALGRGCENSAATGGALLTTSGFADPDSTRLRASGLLPDTLAMFLQGDAQLGNPVPLGDGLRCVGGNLRRLYLASASGGIATVPMPGQLPLGVRSALLGVPITPGSTRFYQVWYRDPDASFCAAPPGNFWNVSNGVRVDW